MITVTKMELCHVAAVAELEKICFSMPWSENAIRAELSNALSLWLVALDGEKVVGYVGSQAVLGEADVMNIAVNPQYRRRGIGKTLIENLINQLAGGGNYALTLEVRASNAPATEMYGKLGFSQVGRRPGYYSKPREDALILRKEWER